MQHEGGASMHCCRQGSAANPQKTLPEQFLLPLVPRHRLSPELKPHTLSDPSSYLAGVVYTISHEKLAFTLALACVFPVTTLPITCPSQDQVCPMPSPTYMLQFPESKQGITERLQECRIPLSSLLGYPPPRPLSPHLHSSFSLNSKGPASQLLAVLLQVLCVSP